MPERNFDKGGIYKTNHYNFEYDNADVQKERMSMKGLGSMLTFEQQGERSIGHGYRGYITSTN